jgi:hypothetical protein
MEIHPTSIRSDRLPSPFQEGNLTLQPALETHQELSGMVAQETPQAAFQLHIEQVIIEGQTFAPGSKNKLVQALQEELSILFQASREEGGVGIGTAHHSLVDVSSQPFLRIPTLSWQSGDPGAPGNPGQPGYASELGQTLARVIYHALTTPDRRSDER